MVSTLVAPDRDSDSGSGVQGNKEQPCFMAGLVGIQSFSDTFFFTLKDPTWKKNHFPSVTVSVLPVAV